MNKKEAITQLEIMATNATGRLGSAKSEEEKALLNKHIEALDMGIDAIRWRNSLILISSGTVEEPKDIHEYPMNKEDMEALIEDINPKEIASHIETDTLIEWCEILRHKLIRTLNKMETAEPKTGHWIGTEYDGYADGHPVYDVYECSECGMEYDATDDGEITHNYCPNCGAKMERSKE